jgi:hypothetical protein
MPQKFSGLLPAFALCILLCSMSSHAQAYDPYSPFGGYGERFDSNQPEFERQWWEKPKAQPQQQPQLQQDPLQTGTRQNNAAACKDTTRLKQLRSRLAEDTARFHSCLGRANAYEDCGREYDALKRQQQDHEDEVRLLNHQCR